MKNKISVVVVVRINGNGNKDERQKQETCYLCCSRFSNYVVIRAPIIKSPREETKEDIRVVSLRGGGEGALSVLLPLSLVLSRLVLFVTIGQGLSSFLKILRYSTLHR